MAKNLRSLEAQIERLRKEAEEIKAKEVAGVISRIKEAIAFYELTPDDLFGLRRQGGKRSKEKGTTRRGASSRKGTVPIKYRDADGNTWTGRGLKPRWLTAALATGKSLQDFAV